MSYEIQFAVCKNYSDGDNSLAFTINPDQSVFGIYNNRGFGYIGKPLDDSNNKFIKAEVINDTYLNYICKPPDGEENSLTIKFENIKYFIACDNGYGLVTNRDDNDGFFLKNTTVTNNLAYFNFLNYIGNNNTEPDNLFGKSNEKVTTIVLMPHYLKDDQTIKIWSNAFKNYRNLQNVFIYGDVQFINIYPNDKYDLLHEKHDGKINFYFIKPAKTTAADVKEINIDDYESHYNNFIEEIKKTKENHENYNITKKTILFAKFITEIVKLHGAINDVYFGGALMFKYQYRRYESSSKKTASINPTI